MTLLDEAVILLTLVVLESVLSFDNAAILAAMSRRLPLGEGRRRALNYGLAIAYVLRLLAILGIFILLKYEWLLTIGGLYLVALWVKHTVELLRGHDDDSPADDKDHPAKAHFGMSALNFTILQIGVVNLAFSLDQIVAAVGFTKNKWLIVIAAAIGVGSLRLIAPYLSRLMDWLPILEDMAYIAVGFVGILLVLEHPFFFPSPEHGLHALAPYKVPFTLGLFLIPVLVKLIFKVPKSHPGTHPVVERVPSHSPPSLQSLEKASRDERDEE
jgi:YkoY family integral membrane protein